MDEKSLGEKNQYGYTVYTGNTGNTSSATSERNTNSTISRTNSDINRFNWGAFFLNWIWCLFNCKPSITVIYIFVIPLFTFIPVIGNFIFFGACVWLGIKGNELAWANKRWKSVEYFHEVQRKWVQGFFMFLVAFLIFILVATEYLKNNPEMMEKLEKYHNQNGSTISQPVADQSNSLLSEMGTARYSIKKLPDNVVNYLKTSSKYSRFDDGKKLVIYFSVPNCPYAKGAASVVSQAKGMDYYNSAYNFYQLSGNRTENYTDMDEYKAGHKLYSMCGQFCIINLYRNEIFSFPGLRTEEVNRVGSVLLQLHDW